MLKYILSIIWQAIIAITPEEELKKAFKEVIQDWCAKHITAEEITNEIADFGKWLKEKF